MGHIMKKVNLSIFCILAIFAMGSEVIEAKSLENVISGEHRSEQNKSRDIHRNPRETLEFFGIESNMTVVEVWPSGGWYTEILAPYLNDEGQYISASFDFNSDSAFVQRVAKIFLSKLEKRPDLYGNVKHGVLMLPDRVEVADPGSVDLVLTFRNIHNWMARGQERIAIESFYEMLKPGGILGVVEHRGDESVPQDPASKSGYVNQSYMIEIAEEAGFILDASSEINANPLDTKNHSEGVWTLAPTYRAQSDEQKKALSKIGESDRFTLRFKKPL